MTFLGIGPGELLMIIILALVVVGPERLPGMARQAGRLLVTVRNWMQTSPDAALVLRARQEIEQELAQLRLNLLEVQNVRDEVIGVAKQIDDAVSPIANIKPPSISDLLKLAGRANYCGGQHQPGRICSRRGRIHAARRPCAGRPGGQPAGGYHPGRGCGAR